MLRTDQRATQGMTTKNSTFNGEESKEVLTNFINLWGCVVNMPIIRAGDEGEPKKRKQRQGENKQFEVGNHNRRAPASQN